MSKLNEQHSELPHQNNKGHSNNSSLVSLRLKTYQLLEGNINTSLTSQIVNISLIIVIVINVIAVILESESSFSQAFHSELLWLERISLSIFTIEYLLRFWASVEARQYKNLSSFKARLRYFFTPMALIDLIAILPFIIVMFFTIDLRVLRLIRILRLLKLTHYFKGFNIFIIVLSKEIQSITISFMVMIFLIIIAASLMHSVEGHIQPEAFGSIINSFWWAVVTMTTIGYGDVVPITTAGKFVATFIMLIGVGVVALPAAMLAARFGEELRERKKNLSVHIKEALANGDIDEREHEYLSNLANRLELQPEDLERSINLLEQSHKNYQNKQPETTHSQSKKCPHCGK